MDLKDIIQNQEKIVACAKSFRNDANALMNGLAQDFNFSLEYDKPFPNEIFRHKYNNKGIFRNDWTYYFHGAECRFDNLKTGQIIEFIIVNKPEFGYLDCYFFFNYIKSTNKFQSLGDCFSSHLEVANVIEILADKNILTKVDSVNIKRNIIAL